MESLFTKIFTIFKQKGAHISKESFPQDNSLQDY